MKRYLALAIVFLAVGAAALADCRVTTIRAVRSHHAPVVAVEAHAAYSYYPSYAIGYAPDLTEVVKLLIEDNKQMRDALIQQLRAGPGAAILPTKELPIGLRTLQTRCATCHEAAVAKAKGGGKELFKGGVFLDTPENVGAVVAAIREGRMPKGGKLNAEDKYETLFFLAVKE